MILTIRSAQAGMAAERKWRRLAEREMAVESRQHCKADMKGLDSLTDNARLYRLGLEALTALRANRRFLANLGFSRRQIEAMDLPDNLVLGHLHLLGYCRISHAASPQIGQH